MTTFVAVGHVCHDVAPGGYRLGGAAAYSSITARNLGADARIFTSFAEDFDTANPLLDGIEMRWVDALETTTFHNVYTNGRRRQRLLSVANPLKGDEVPPAWRETEIVYLCPIADEVRADILTGFTGKVVGATPQGWLRAWDAEGYVRAKRWETAEQILPALDVLVLSEEDFAPFPDELDRYRALAKRVVVTRGRIGATLYEGNRAREFPAYAAEEVDPTGAGDVFACAFLLCFARTGNVEEAMDLANCVASFAVEGVGTTGIPTRERVEERWGRSLPF